MVSSPLPNPSKSIWFPLFSRTCQSLYDFLSSPRPVKDHLISSLLPNLSDLWDFISSPKPVKVYMTSSPLQRMHRISSELRSEPPQGRVSTELGDRSGAPLGAATFARAPPKTCQRLYDFLSSPDAVKVYMISFRLPNLSKSI